MKQQYFTTRQKEEHIDNLLKDEFYSSRVFVHPKGIVLYNSIGMPFICVCKKSQRIILDSRIFYQQQDFINSDPEKHKDLVRKYTNKIAGSTWGVMYVDIIDYLNDLAVFVIFYSFDVCYQIV